MTMTMMMIIIIMIMVMRKIWFDDLRVVMMLKMMILGKVFQLITYNLHCYLSGMPSSPRQHPYDSRRRRVTAFGWWTSRLKSSTWQWLLLQASSSKPNLNRLS